MTNDNPAFMVSIYLRGDNLDPKHVSARLGVNPTDSQRKGDKIITFKNREIIKKIGVWALTASTESETLSDHLEELAAKIKADGKFIESIANVEEAFIDIYVSSTRNKETVDTSEFELSKENIVALGNFGLPVKFTVTFVDE